MPGRSNILSKYIQAGCNVDLQAVAGSTKKSGADDEKPTIYHSRVIDVLSDEKLEIAMPMEKSKLVLLPLNKVFGLSFYSENKLYKCRAKVVNRYKDQNMYIVVFELTTKLSKHQRREFYRFDCNVAMDSRQLLSQETYQGIKKEEILDNNLPFEKSTIVDISGGGMRFVTKHVYDAQSLILCRFHLTVNRDDKEFNLIGKVLNVRETDNLPGLFEHRIEFVDVDATEQEEIIKYIFDEERKALKMHKRDS